MSRITQKKSIATHEEAYHIVAGHAVGSTYVARAQDSLDTAVANSRLKSLHQSLVGAGFSHGGERDGNHVYAKHHTTIHVSVGKVRSKHANPNSKPTHHYVKVVSAHPDGPTLKE